MSKDQRTKSQKEKSDDRATITNQGKTYVPENDAFISEKDEVKYAEDRLREQVKKKH